MSIRTALTTAIDARDAFRTHLEANGVDPQDPTYAALHDAQTDALDAFEVELTAVIDTRIAQA